MLVNNNMEFVDMFENKLCQYTGAKYAVCTDCCTNAILISIFLKLYLKELSKNAVLVIPNRTYMSIPMTLKLFGFKVVLEDYEWYGNYEILHKSLFNTGIKIFDAAVDFKEDMMKDYPDGSLVCLSFQQKKRLNLGRGGAILTNDENYYKILKRLVHDGRNPKIYHGNEINSSPANIICGFHSYLEPEKAAKGLMMLNQREYLPPYIEHSFKDYPDLTKLEVLK